MFETTLQCMMLSMSEQGHPHIAHHVFVDMYVWNVHSVLAVVSKSAQKANHSPQLYLKPFMFDIPLQCSTARNLLLSASLPSFPSIGYKCFCVVIYVWSFFAVLVVVSKSAEKSKHSSWSNIQRQPTFNCIKTSWPISG